MRIPGPRIVLREFRLDDLDASMAIVGDPEVTRWLSFDTRTRVAQAERLAEDVARARSEPRPDYYLAAVTADGTCLVGFARLGLGPHRSGELGYAVRRDHWGQGYATEAARLVLDLAFGTLGLHRVQAACGPDNVPSRAVLARLGFRYEGRLRHHVFTNGAWRDSLLYALLEDEWPVPGPGAEGARR
ncbi:MAG TPA: GNAT family protein [Acidimicrobiales bacterium]